MKKRKPKPNLLGDIDRKPEFPLIEIVGPVDTGKRLLAQLLARRIGGNCMCFPCLDPTKEASKRLLVGITSGCDEMLNNSKQWQDLYAAHLFEHAPKMRAYLQLAPLVVVNYRHSYHTWYRTLTGKNLIPTWAVGLPIVSKSYGIVGPKWAPPGNLDARLPDLLEKAIEAALGFKRVFAEIECPPHQMHTAINDVAILFTNDIKRKFEITHPGNYTYTIGSLPGRPKILRKPMTATDISLFKKTHPEIAFCKDQGQGYHCGKKV